MDARPVRRQGVPGYPTRLEVAADPDLLRTRLPPAWLSRAETAGAAALFLAANMAGCDTTRPASEPAGGPPAALPVATAPAVTSKAPAATPDWPAVVAPIFEHGEGRASGGCIAVVPPVFLSEEEALQVITEELVPHGVHLSAKDVLLHGVAIPGRGIRAHMDGRARTYEEEIVVHPENAKPLSVDGLDPARGVAVEFVSRSDYGDLGGPSPENFTSSVSRWYLKDAAQWVADHVAKQGTRLKFGAFYDPVTVMKPEAFARFVAEWAGNDQWTGAAEAWERVANPMKAESKRLLRQQVRDFVEWLKAQGAI